MCHILWGRWYVRHMPPTSKQWTSKKRFHRRSVRLKTADYGPGTTALITINCQDRQRFFGYNNRGTIEYSAAGRIVVETIAEMHEHHACKIEASIVMPEHVHVLILVAGDEGTISQPRAFASPVAGTIPVMINHLKGAVTRRINDEITSLCGVKIWQRGFHDRVVRDGDLTNIISYINNNPMKHYLKEQNKKRMNDRSFGHGKGS